MLKTAKLTIKIDEVIGEINPNIYGHFIEHLGRCICPGIWVGEDSKIPNNQGLRKTLSYIAPKHSINRFILTLN